MTRDEAIAACLAEGGWHRDACEEYVADRMVGDVYCEGSIVVDAAGSRCVPREIVDRTDAARTNDPLPPKPTSGLTGVIALAALATLAYMGAKAL